MSIGSRGTFATSLILVATIILAACEEAQAPGDDDDSGTENEVTVEPTAPDSDSGTGAVDQLIGPEWELQEINGNDPIEGTRVTLQFAPDRFSGFGGCNHYGGPYEMTNGAIQVAEISSDQQDCQEPDGVMSQEHEYFETLLEDGIRFEVTDTALELSNPGGELLLEFTSREPFATDPSDLDGTDWQLTSFDGDAVLDGSRLMLGFDGREFHGYAGCRSLEGSFQSDGDRVHVGYLGMTSFNCLRPERFRLQEGRYVNGLGSLAYVNLTDGQLELHTMTGNILLFEPLTDEAGHEPDDATWVLDHFILGDRTEPALPGTEVTLTFEDGVVYERGQIAGSGGCNRYEAEYSLDGASLPLESFQVTEMGCAAPDGIMEQEQRFIEILNATPSYYNDDDELRLSTDEGDVLVFVPHDQE